MVGITNNQKMKTRDDRITVGSCEKDFLGDQRMVIRSLNRQRSFVSFDKCTTSFVRKVKKKIKRYSLNKFLHTYS